jgi:hypothetical protein
MPLKMIKIIDMIIVNIMIIENVIVIVVQKVMLIGIETE